MRTYIGIDNGITSNGIAILKEGELALLHKLPVFSSQDYTKKKKNISRINAPKLIAILTGLNNPIAVLERPMVNPKMFHATISAVRAMEATLIVLETLLIPYRFIDSKEWQKEMLPSGCKGKELKTASLDVGKRLFPHLELKGDADSLLIAEYARRKNF